MASFSLTEKLAVTGAFLAVVALAVGTEDDPGMVVTSPETVKELRPPAAAPLAPSAVPAAGTALPAPSPVQSPLAEVTGASAAPTEVETAQDDKEYSPELGRVPLDFSNGPPPT